MHDEPIFKTTTIVYLIAAISGALGGVAVSSFHALRGRPISCVFVYYYMSIGIAFGVGSVAFAEAFNYFNQTINHLIFFSLMSSAFGTITVAVTNLSAKFILRKIGKEIDIVVRDIEE